MRGNALVFLATADRNCASSNLPLLTVRRWPAWIVNATIVCRGPALVAVRQGLPARIDSQETKQCRQVADASASSSCAKSQDSPRAKRFQLVDPATSRRMTGWHCAILREHRAHSWAWDAQNTTVAVVS